MQCLPMYQEMPPLPRLPLAQEPRQPSVSLTFMLMPSVPQMSMPPALQLSVPPSASISKDGATTAISSIVSTSVSVASIKKDTSCASGPTDADPPGTTNVCAAASIDTDCAFGDMAAGVVSDTFFEHHIQQSITYGRNPGMALRSKSTRTRKTAVSDLDAII